MKHEDFLHIRNKISMSNFIASLNISLLEVQARAERQNKNKRQTKWKGKVNLLHFQMADLVSIKS